MYPKIKAMKSYTFSIIFICHLFILNPSVFPQKNPLIRTTLNERIEFGNVQAQHITDLRIHLANQVDEILKNYFTEPFPESGKNPLTGDFILGNDLYAANLYAYIWALVYAQDVLSVFRENGILNPNVGEKYRKEILAPGATKPVNELLFNFLGRESNQSAFLKAYGLE